MGFQQLYPLPAGGYRAGLGRWKMTLVSSSGLHYNYSSRWPVARARGGSYRLPGPCWYVCGSGLQIRRTPGAAFTASRRAAAAGRCCRPTANAQHKRGRGTYTPVTPGPSPSPASGLHRRAPSPCLSVCAHVVHILIIYNLTRNSSSVSPEASSRATLRDLLSEGVRPQVPAMALWI